MVVIRSLLPIVAQQLLRSRDFIALFRNHRLPMVRYSKKLEIEKKKKKKTRRCAIIIFVAIIIAIAR